MDGHIIATRKAVSISSSNHLPDVLLIDMTEYPLPNDEVRYAKEQLERSINTDNGGSM
jgi:hypothetical protein